MSLLNFLKVHEEPSREPLFCFFFFFPSKARLLQSAAVHYALLCRAVLHFWIAPINQSDKVFNERQLEC